MFTLLTETFQTFILMDEDEASMTMMMLVMVVVLMMLMVVVMAEAGTNCLAANSG